MLVQIPEEERLYYETHGPAGEGGPEGAECTACRRPIRPPFQPETALRHPELGVLICRHCKKRYHQGEWTRCVGF